MESPRRVTERALSHCRNCRRAFDNLGFATASKRQRGRRAANRRSALACQRAIVSREPRRHYAEAATMTCKRATVMPTHSPTHTHTCTYTRLRIDTLSSQPLVNSLHAFGRTRWYPWNNFEKFLEISPRHVSILSGSRESSTEFRAENSLREFLHL